jgi:hypothetical protein
MNTRFLTLLLSLAFFGFSSSVMAHACFKDDRPGHRHCIDGPGPVVTPEYTAALTVGGFRFNPVGITPNNRDSGYNTVLQLNMGRPVTTSVPSGQTAWEPLVDELMWDTVFLNCYEVLANTTITGVSVGSEWGITQGGRKKSDTATNIRITLRDVVAAPFPYVDIDFLFYTAGSYPRSAFFPDRGTKMTYNLERGHIWADDITNHTSCNSAFGLEKPVTLEICHKNIDGSGCG